jgi:hypothetical protein
MSRTSTTLAFFLAALAGCGRQSTEYTPGFDPAATPPAEVVPPEALAAELDAALSAACPVSDPADATAFTRCADALTNLPVLRQNMAEPFNWGGQTASGSLVFEQSDRTDLNPRIWRRLYLATFMFAGGHRIEMNAETAIIRVPIRFRNQLDPGSFPYPFWHSTNKWRSYESAREILFFVRGGKLIGALRSVEKDPDSAHREMVWDGRWSWEDTQGPEPRVTLFSYSLSPANPHVAELDQSYRALEKELRRENCMLCHSPDNVNHTNPLELFSYPNQALSGRHGLIKVLQQNAMPPGTGIADLARRAELLELAHRFVQLGDDALEFEGEPTPVR